MNFKEQYLEMKAKNLTDKEIALEMRVCRETLTNWKKAYKLTHIRKPRRNNCNVSEKVIQAGVEKGISRRLLLRRIREYGYSEYEAVHTPKNARREFVPNLNPEVREKKNARQKEYYKKRKLAVLRG